MKRRESSDSEMRFPKVWCLYMPCSKVKRPRPLPRPRRGHSRSCCHMTAAAVAAAAATATAAAVAVAVAVATTTAASHWKFQKNFPRVCFHQIYGTTENRNAQINNIP